MSAWKKSSRSNGNGGNNCVEVQFTEDVVRVRNSRFPEGPILDFTKDEWAAFIEGADEFKLEGK